MFSKEKLLLKCALFISFLKRQFPIILIQELKRIEKSISNFCYCLNKLYGHFLLTWKNAKLTKYSLNKMTSCKNIILLKAIEFRSVLSHFNSDVSESEAFHGFLKM